ncbi:MAG TPA: hypothetical protein VMV49_06845 [Candidatus Deferrimicrobium sp.]|nr:hypothetical protein [Candidatus Deferrimicrobium sp.]
MKKQIVIVLSIIICFNAIWFIPNNINAYNPFNSVETGDQLFWKVLDYNEPYNTIDPANWYRMSDFSNMGNYVLLIGDSVGFTVDDPENGTGTLDIGNMTISAVTRADIGFNLNLITGPAYPPYQNSSLILGLLSSTNWQEHFDEADNVSLEIGATIINQSTYMIFLELNRSVIAFTYIFGDQITYAIYDEDTGILLYYYSKHGLWRLSMIITTAPSEIPSFIWVFSIPILASIGFIFYLLQKKHHNVELL